MNGVARGFTAQEFEQRLLRAQQLMAMARLDALLLTTEPEVRYFTGFLTRFWESPTRPWFLLVPATGKPVAVIPTIGAELMGKTWIEDIRTWRSPDLADDGVALLADAIRNLVGNGGRIGLPTGHETLLRMPLQDFQALSQKLTPLQLVGDDDILRRLRMVKSPAEIDKIETACAIGGRAFERVGDIAKEGIGLEEVFRRFQMVCLEEGADWVPYLAGGAGKNGYADVISPAAAAPLNRGDVLMLDTGLVWDGYFCDFDRNFAIGESDETASRAHQNLVEATQAGFEVAKPGARAADLFHAMDRIVTGGKGTSEVGRLGHGLGMQLTEWPSLIPDDYTVLEEGMVLTLEPGIETGRGRMMVHEENIVITRDGARWLTDTAEPALPAIG
ncbi:MAG: aminopeptidase P family protein [Hyphomicrobiales bacterium]|nr:aminopeptidase P family protein [Hyphomicrobiales bacterium]MCP5001837.1 aminopeptidase P family protein [Hyphomicrobiales bacterium]